MEPMLEIRNLTAGYGDTDILHGVNLEVRPREIVAIVGPNGAGKSTVLNAVMNLIIVRGGDIRFRGRSILKTGAERLKNLGLAYVPQVRNVFPSLTVHENLIVGSRRGPQLDARIEECLGIFPALTDRLKMRAGALSGGERQMLAFARGLVSGPDLILLDEPSAALSPILAEAIFEKILEIHSAGTTILLVEQNVRMALQIGHRGYILDSGKNALDGPGRDLLENPDMARLYLGGSAPAGAGGKSDQAT